MHKMKRIIAMCLVLCMLLSVLPMHALADSITIHEKPDNGTTQGQPFAPGTGGSNNFRIPGIVTLNNGTLIATSDARWNGSADAGGLDTIVSVSTDNGANWTYTFANYLGDNGNTWINTSSCIIDPAIGTDGTTAYMIADLFPAGFAINSARYAAQTGSTGFNAEGNLILRSDSENNLTFGDNGYETGAKNATYGYYLEEGKIFTTAGAEVEGYTVDAYFNITGNDVNTNLFFSDSPFKPFPTDYLYLTTTTDGLNWSAPELLKLKDADEQTLLVGPGNGTYDASTGRMVFTAYDYTFGYQRACVIWREIDGTWHRTEDASVNDWSSEASVVALDDGTLRCFYRDGYSVVRYTDFVWSEAAGNYVRDAGATQVSTTASRRSNNQLSAIRYSETINGKEAILVACAAYTGDRKDGHLYVFLVNDDNTMDLAYDYDIFPGEIETYAYNCISEMNDGNIALLYENAGAAITYHVIDMEDVLIRENDPSLTIKNVELLVDHTATFTDNSGYYVDDDTTELNESIATVDMTGETHTTYAAKVLGSGATVDLDSCQYTFTKGEDGYFEVSATTGDGETVYLNHFSTANNNVPNVTSPAGKIDIRTSNYQDMFKLVAKNIDGSNASDRGLHFHMEAATPYWNRCGNDTSAKCHEYLYRKAGAGETASTEIPGYIRITAKDQIEDGGQYLIAAKNDAGNWYVLNPASTTTAGDHVAQIMGSTTVGHTEITFTGVGAGYTEVVIGSTLYKLTVNAVDEVNVEVPVGTTVTVTEPNGNNANADTTALDASIATVTLTGDEGTAANGLSLTPVSDLTTGKYVIINTRANKIVNNTPNGNGLLLDGTVNADIAASAIWTINAVDGGYTVQDQNGKYMTISSAKANVVDAETVLTLNFTGSVWTIGQNGQWMNHYGGSSSTTAAGHGSIDGGSEFHIYSYTDAPYAARTKLAFTGMKPGTTELLVGRTNFIVNVTAKVQNVTLNVGEHKSFPVSNATIAAQPDGSIVSVEFCDFPIGRLGTDASFNGNTVDLADCLFTFTKNEDGTWCISSTDVEGNPVYLEAYASTNGYPVTSNPETVTISDGFADGTVKMFSVSESAGRQGYLFFWRDGKNYYDRVDKTDGFESGVSFFLYEQQKDGTYAAINGKDDIVSGNRYLIVADAGNYGKFVTYPTTSRSTRHTQIAKMDVGTGVTITANAVGHTTMTIPGYCFDITVNEAAAHEHSYTGEITTAATCGDTGVMTYTCSCGANYTEEIPATGNHSWDNGVVTIEPTLEAEGVKTYTCSVCGGTKTESIAKLEAGLSVQPLMDGWNHGTVSLADCEYTFTKNGYAGYSVCHGGNYYVNANDGTPQTNVLFNTLTVDHQNNKIKFMKNGSLFMYYNEGKPYWGKVSSVTGNETDGTGLFYLLKANPNGTFEGFSGYDVITSKYNIVSGDSYLIAANFGDEWFIMYPSTEAVSIAKVVNVAATHTHDYKVVAGAEGMKTEECECGHIHVSEASQDAHTLTHVEAKDPTCTEPGNIEYWHCSECDGYWKDEVCTVSVSKDVVTISAYGHNHVADVTAPTCTEKGYTTYTCSRCNDTYTSAEVAAKGHDYGTLIEAVEAVHTPDTLTPAVAAHYYCAACKTYFDEEKNETTLAALTGETPVHTPADAVEENRVESTCTVAGSYDSVVYCSVCKTHVISRETVALELAAHTPAEPVKENETATGYDLVIRCSVCSTVLESEHVDSMTDKVVMLGKEVRLESEIQMQYRVSIPESLINDGAYVVMAKTGAYGEVTKTYTVDELKAGENLVTMGVAPAEITAPISITVYDGTGLAQDLYNNDGVKLDDASRTVAGYAVELLKDENKKDLAVALLTYGGYAQQYFNVDANNPAFNLLANLGYNVPDLDAVTVDNMANYRNTQTNANMGVKATTVATYVDSNIRIRVYLAVEGDINDYTFTLETPNGVKEVKAGYDQASQRYYVDVTEIASGYIDYEYKITITGDKGTNVITASVLAYARSVLSKSTDEKLLNLAKALYLYNQAANAYYGV